VEGLQHALVVIDDKDSRSLTLFCGILRGEGSDLFVLGRRNVSVDEEHIVRVCDLLEKSSVNRCCRHACAGHTIRPVAALVKRPVVPAFILVYRYASEQAQYCSLR
jgi:hypothetical protein